jgi:septal ring factor EnvC (AmiA/AmiB activator)
MHGGMGPPPRPMQNTSITDALNNMGFDRGTPSVVDSEQGEDSDTQSTLKAEVACMQEHLQQTQEQFRQSQATIEQILAVNAHLAAQLPAANAAQSEPALAGQLPAANAAQSVPTLVGPPLATTVATNQADPASAGPANASRHVTV